MTGDPVYRPEFELYMTESSKREERTTKAIEKMVTENKTTNGLLNANNSLLAEYINKHDRIEERVNENSDNIRDLTLVVEANTKLTSIVGVLKKGAVYVSASALTTGGAILAYNWWG